MIFRITAFCNSFMKYDIFCFIQNAVNACTERYVQKKYRGEYYRCHHRIHVVYVCTESEETDQTYDDQQVQIQHEAV